MLWQKTNAEVSPLGYARKLRGSGREDVLLDVCFGVKYGFSTGNEPKIGQNRGKQEKTYKNRGNLIDKGAGKAEGELPEQFFAPA